MSVAIQSKSANNNDDDDDDSFWENNFLARDLEVLKSIYIYFRVDVSDQHGPSSDDDDGDDDGGGSD